MAPVMMQSAQRAVRPTRSAVKAFAVQRTQPKTIVPKTFAAGLAAAGLLVQAGAARAAEADQLDSTVDTVVGAVKATGEAVKAGITTIQSGVKLLQESTVTDVLESAGVDFSSVSEAAGTVSDVAESAYSAASPVAQGLAEALSASDPLTLAEFGLGAVALYYVAPAVLGLFRGFAGELTAAVALDTVAQDASAVLIDIRPAREKEASGVPDVPGASASKVLEVEFAALEDKKLRSQLKDPSFIEAQTTALQIASLRRIGTGSKVILLDRYGGVAEQVARELAKKGYSRTYIVTGGFDGRAGWIQSKLQIKPYTATNLTFSAPAFGRTGTTSTRRLPAPRAL
ncbi:Calcium sensing receptor, chloroplastic [Tetrabaena socialis]|uniref:Calcium sensing receptor, chloroplastic n=1 Tax=Tetrabaena socialis TaxID=47790 RepID=A0A2J7ZMM4_9CHLO|nr:Calcium sensing receptor, chloroplastic [Tetrabaena socialis]|eukprot:PNH01519.1 Calcium sensing receptor, chloroplastic [Tetrabaena socialis]